MTVAGFGHGQKSMILVEAKRGDWGAGDEDIAKGE